MTSPTFVVQGMSCDHCVHAVTEEVEKLPGVRNVRIDLGTGEVTVDSDSPLSASAVATAIDEAGYKLVA